MQTLTATLLSAQRSRNAERLCKIVLSSGATRYGYDLSDRLLRSSLTIQPDSHTAQVVLRNTDASLSALALRGYQGVISHGYMTGVARTAWVTNTAYSLDDIRVPTTANGYQYRCSVAGTSREDLSTYTEVDTNSKLTVTATKATGADVDRDEDVYLYKDKGADFFDALDIDFEIFIASTSLSIGTGGMAIANAIGSISAFGTTDLSAFAHKLSTYYYIYLMRGAGVAYDRYMISADTLYYCTLARVAGSTTATVNIYSDATRTTLLDTLTLSNFGTAKWRYIYGFANFNAATGGQDFDGYVQNLCLGEPTWPTTLGAVVTDGTVTWEMDGLTGSEYARTPPLRVRIPDFFSSHGKTAFALTLFGIPDQLKLDCALSALAPDASNTDTVKDWMNKIADATLAPYTHCEAITIDWDSEDSLIDVYIPADTMQIYEGDSRWAMLEKLIGWTKCVMEIGVDGHIHVLSPTVSGSSYDYTFDDDYMDADAHTFFTKDYRNALVLPNKITIHNADSSASGNYTSAASYALLPKERSYPMTLVDSAQGTAIATAMIQKLEQEAEKGTGTAPMNVGQELYDYVDIIDSVQDDERAGNIGYIRFDVARGKFDQTFGFGKILLGSTIGSGAGAQEGGGTFTYDQVVGLINDVYSNLNMLVDTLTQDGFTIQQVETSIPDDLDALADGTSYKRVLSTQLSAGKIYLSDVSTYMAGYDPSGKRRVFTAEPTTPYDVGDLWLCDTAEAGINRCITALASGAFNAAHWTAQTLDGIKEGTTYEKVRATDISSGHINLYSGTVATGVWYNKVGVVLDADYGIGLYGGQIALRTFPTYQDLLDGTNLQCYVGTDGKIYAGAGAVTLDASGITLTGQNLLIFKRGADIRGYVFASSGSDTMNLLGASADVYIAPGSGKKSNVISLDTTPVDQTASRALNTTYTNSGTKPLFITVSLQLATGNTTVIAIHASADPPTTIVAQGANTVGGTITLSMSCIVPVGWKYACNSIAGVMGVWIETDIG